MIIVYVLLAASDACRRVLKRALDAEFVFFHRPSDTGKAKHPRTCANAIPLVCTVLGALAMATGLTSAALGATVTLRPNGAGDETTITDVIGATNHWEAVDEEVADSDVTYVYTVSATYLTDLYAMADATGYSGTIDSVTVHMNCAPELAPLQASAYTRIKTNGVADDGTPETLGEAKTYGVYSTTYINNPQSSSPWTWTEINALQAGVALTECRNGKYSACTQVWVVVSYTPPTLTISGVSIAPGTAQPGETEVGMEKLIVSTDVGQVTWTDVKVDLTGTAADGDISSVEIWKDDGDGIWEGTTQDTEIGSGAFSSGTVTIDINDQTITTISSQTFYVVYDIAPEANPDAIARASLVDSTYIIVSSPATVSNTNFPLQSYDTSLPVKLCFFTATDSAGVVVLRWTVESQVDNAWFNLLRSGSRHGEYAQIARIPGRGTTPFRWEYSYIDRDITPGQTYWYKLVDVSYAGETTEHGPVQVLPVAEEVPQDCLLRQNYPNPFNPATVIGYQLSEQRHISLSIYNTRGQLVRTLIEGRQNPGYGSVRWDGRGNTGVDAASGIYFCVFKVDQELFQMKKMALIR